MLIIGLMLGIVVVIGIIFLVVKSLSLKLLSMTLLVIALVLVISLGGSKVTQLVRPMTIEDNTVQIYQDGKPVKFEVSDVGRVDITNEPGEGKKITFIVEGFMYDFTVSELAYSWTLRNELNERFSKVIHDATF